MAHQAQEATVRSLTRIGWIAAVSGLAAGALSCGQNTRTGRGENEPVTTGLAAMERGDSPTPRVATPDPNAPPEPGSVDAMAQQAAIDLERALAAQPSRDARQPRRAEIDSRPSNPGTATSEATAIADGSSVSVGLVSVERTAPQARDEQPPSVSAGLASMEGSADAPAGEAPLDERIRLASVELARLLTDRAAASAAPAADLVVASVLAVNAGDPIPGHQNLAPSERSAVAAVSGLVGALKPGTEGAAAIDAADALQKSADEASVGLPLRITDARLCTRVNGFGDYVELGVNAFLAGRPSPVIVYTQVDRFASRASAGGRQTVELSQELNIYHDADGAHCWKRPAQTISESTRSKRRDFYLTNAIELPPTLTIGKYRLKVTMRDLTGGAVAETTIPFSIVADPGLAHTAE